jgi:hypothetical protein
MSAGPGGVGKQRREPQHQAVDGDVVDLDATLDERLLDVAVGQAEAQLPPDRQHDCIRREEEAMRRERPQIRRARAGQPGRG